MTAAFRAGLQHPMDEFLDLFILPVIVRFALTMMFCAWGCVVVVLSCMSRFSPLLPLATPHERHAR